MKLNANGTEISILTNEKTFDDNFLSLTDIARKKNPFEPKDVVKNWMRLRSTIDYLGLWEQINNPDFKGVEFDTFRNQAGTNAFTLTPQRWIETTDAIGIISKSGRYGGTYAHSDIAFEFASWISPEFKLYIIKDYQRLKKEDAKRHAIGWDSKRELSKINYRIHTDAIKEFLMTPELSPQEINYKYASEADLLNMALFGKTAKQWRDETGIARENIRDYASIEQLIILINLESMNADLIREGLAQNERLKKLRSVAYYQMQSLTQNKSIQKIKDNILEEKQE
ncbi:MAG: KilA-N domain-containing protein [Muricomes sp.]|uniref:KilA-N domain-containing protein n=1 Tax=Faecalicatena contorta TaxID=39482 RepID=UPI002EC1771E|nr:KilA-N domain-containing protein [Muricomes sp.]